MSISGPTTVMAIFLCFLANPVVSKELSTEEILELFRLQQEGSNQIRGAFGNQSEIRRGLVLITSENGGTSDMKEIEFEAVISDVEVTKDILFDLNSSILRADQHQKLASICEAMLGMDGAFFRVIGHTDSSGPASYNDKLSVRRADAVRSHLTDVCGVEQGHLQAVGVGERYLRDTINPRSEINRRVEFQALTETINQ